MFEICNGPVKPVAPTAQATTQMATRLADPACGGYVSFEGWVRNHHEGRAVRELEYEVYEPLALTEGNKVLTEALARFEVEKVACVHSQGRLAIGEMAVWVGVSAHHRDAAFDACRYIIDEIKVRLPIWKKEFYVEGESGWVNCQRCADNATPENAQAQSQEG